MRIKCTKDALLQSVARITDRNSRNCMCISPLPSSLLHRTSLLRETRRIEVANRWRVSDPHLLPPYSCARDSNGRSVVRSHPATMATNRLSSMDPPRCFSGSPVGRRRLAGWLAGWPLRHGVRVTCADGSGGVRPMRGSCAQRPRLSASVTRASPVRARARFSKVEGMAQTIARWRLIDLFAVTRCDGAVRGEWRDGCMAIRGENGRADTHARFRGEHYK